MRWRFAAAKTLADKVQLFSMLANIGDTRSLIIHPASTTHSQVAEPQRKALGISEETIRVSIGIEDVADILADLDQALKAAAGKQAA
ncbi:MAG: PLP-dependent transferase [Alphaproteobacteria bacterium]